MYEIVAFTKANHATRPIRHDVYFADPKAHWPVLATVEQVAYCTCADPAPRLQNRRWPGIDGGFQIAGWPYEGGSHSPNCGFFKFSLEGEGSARHIAAIRVMADETFDATPDFELERPQSVPPAWEFDRWCNRARSEVDAASSGRASLLGLLDFLLMTARLNEYSPGEVRDWRELRRRLTCRVRCGRLNQKPLAERMVVMPTSHDKARFKAVAAQFAPTESGFQRFLILGDPKRGFKNQQTTFQLGPRGPSLILAAETRDRLNDRFPIPFAALESQRDVVLGLFLVEVQDEPGDILDRIRVIDGALSLLSWPSFVPVDSHYEALVAKQLVDVGRSFLKPMTMDSSLGMVPDFILRDKGSTEYVEVWGIDSEEYRHRMKEKLARYRELNLELIEWHAYRNDPMPDYRATPARTVSDRKTMLR
jgi:hypothetical protein